MSQPDQLPTTNHPPTKCLGRRRVIRPLVLAVPVALLTLVTACGSSDTPAASGPSTSAAASESSPADASGSVLTGTVGEGDKPVITLMDSTGAAVSSLKAGSYTVKVKDMSAKHNFHLTGTGVDEKTTVPEKTETTWTVKLEAGTYTFVCDPHAKKMVGTFTVT
jgi:plastocyanin